jgi:hypothetical protein
VWPATCLPFDDMAELSEAWAQDALSKLFPQMVTMFNLFFDGDNRMDPRLVVKVKSPLAGDDLRAHPYEPTHAIQGRLSSSLENQHAVYALIVDAQVLHPNVPFTLYRAAIESAATALWMVGPKDRRTRIERCLRWHWQDLADADADTASAAFDIPRTVSLDVLQDRIKVVADRNQIDVSRIKRYLKYTEVVAAADALATGRWGALAPWRLCSGMAHGKMWPTLSFQERQLSLPQSGGIVHMQTTTSYLRVFWAASAAFDLAKDALNLYERRARPVRR